jgi:hypothetical protein
LCMTKFLFSLLLLLALKNPSLIEDWRIDLIGYYHYQRHSYSSLSVFFLGKLKKVDRQANYRPHLVAKWTACHGSFGFLFQFFSSVESPSFHSHGPSTKFIT